MVKQLNMHYFTTAFNMTRLLISFYIPCVSKNVPPLVWYNFDTRERILISFGRNVTDKVSKQKTLYYATSNFLFFCTTCKTGNTKTAFFTRCISALLELNQ